MALARIEIIEVCLRELDNMERTLISQAQDIARAGFDQNFMRLFIEEELKTWKKRAQYKDSELNLEHKGIWEMNLVKGPELVAVFKTIF